MGASMSLKELGSKLDKKIENLFVEWNAAIKQLISHCFGYTLGVAILWPACYLIFQIWTFIVDGYWKSTTLLQIGFVAETQLKGLDLIANYIFDLPLFFSILFTGLIGSLVLYLVVKAIFLFCLLAYLSVKALLTVLTKERTI